MGAAVDRTDVVVAGGGLIGLSVAWRAAQRGLSVTVVDESPGAGASQAAAGMLAPVTEAAYGETDLLRLCLTSLQRYPDFAAEVEAAGGRPVGLRTVGTLVVGFDEDDMRELDALHGYQRELGLAAERLTPRETRRREPSLTPRVRGGLAVDGDHSVDGRALHAGLLAAAEATGVEVLRARVRELQVTDGRATGVVLDGGRELPAGQVVLALGAHSGGLPGVPPLPVRPVKGQILRLAGAEGLLEGTVRALVRGRHVYLVPYAGDGLIIGATTEDRGFDATVTAGGVHDLLHDAIEVVPGVTELELVETLARWRPGTADNAPLLGSSGLPGLVLATGHHRNGVLLTPVTGDVVAEHLATGEVPELAAPFTVDRFVRADRLERTSP
ncbi:glycine oxidase ThiO [Modestobacter muralis]|uniref:glycine oxidase n=1 Tax=Modestobacter muralis TaxID=1608614 RepID=A0A6P0H5S4_9ACTN|nr:glycine oxidase ThiO [Modestobacter muralis]NEK93868.1 glycine oxidase ThiO [Modestobacter muralis]NEN50635.1 glycine oxidase ThiO [Modestobacter muralis]